MGHGRVGVIVDPNVVAISVVTKDRSVASGGCSLHLLELPEQSPDGGLVRDGGQLLAQLGGGDADC